jgi:uncharacterized protein
MKKLGVITGASSGIGKAFAFELAKTHNLVLVARRRDLLNEISGELKKYRSKIKVFVTDLAKESDVKRLERYLSKRSVDILVNAAGFGDSSPFHTSSSDSINDMTYIHVVATTRLSRIVLPGMRDRKQGVIINVASVSGFSKINAGNIVYDSTKAYLIRFSELLQQNNELENNIKIQVLCPGFTETEFFDHHNHGVKIPSFLWMKAEEVVRRSLNKIPSRKTVYIPGWYNILMARIIRSDFLLPLLKFLNNNTIKSF